VSSKAVESVRRQRRNNEKTDRVRDEARKHENSGPKGSDGHSKEGHGHAERILAESRAGKIAEQLRERIELLQRERAERRERLEMLERVERPGRGDRKRH